MYCLDCGNKIDDNEPQCPHCGSSVADMRDRIAEAEEKIAYTDAVSSVSTSKLPLVSERTYTDKDGNPLDPSEEVDRSSYRADAKDLRAIPELGEEDPYITKPMQKIVSDSGKVVADVDREVKVYRQEEPKKASRVKIVAAVIGIAFMVGCFSFVNASTWINVLDIQLPWATSSDTAESDEATATETDAVSEEEQAAQAAEQARTNFQNSLENSYTNLGAWREDVNDVVDGLEGYFGVVNTTTRTGYADECSALLDEITESRTALASEYEALGLAEDDELYASYQDIDALYGYLITRLGVIYQCWEISLTYEDPRGYNSEILEPLYQDLEGGNSVSMTAFDALYPQADPAA